MKIITWTLSGIIVKYHGKYYTMVNLKQVLATEFLNNEKLS